MPCPEKECHPFGFGKIVCVGYWVSPQWDSFSNRDFTGNSMHVCGCVGVWLMNPHFSVVGPRVLPGNSRHNEDLENQWNPVKCAGHSISGLVFRKVSMITASTSPAPDPKSKPFRRQRPNFRKRKPPGGGGDRWGCSQFLILHLNGQLQSKTLGKKWSP